MGVIRQNVHHESRLMTATASRYKLPPVASHEFVDHSKFEWTRGGVSVRRMPRNRKRLPSTVS